MYSLRNSLIAILVICLILPLAKADENTYRVDGLPDNLIPDDVPHIEEGQEGFYRILQASEAEYPRGDSRVINIGIGGTGSERRN